MEYNPRRVDKERDPSENSGQMTAQFDNLKWNADGLIPAIVQDDQTGEVLMMAWMNREALEQTVQTGKTHFYSRSRKKQWMKGESSGHVQTVSSISTDCDLDTLLIKVSQNGAACHDGYYSCFYRQFAPAEPDGWKNIGRRVFDPDNVYKK